MFLPYYFRKRIVTTIFNEKVVDIIDMFLLSYFAENYICEKRWSLSLWSSWIKVRVDKFYADWSLCFSFVLSSYVKLFCHRFFYTIIHWLIINSNVFFSLQEIGDYFSFIFIIAVTTLLYWTGLVLLDIVTGLCMPLWLFL